MLNRTEAPAIRPIESIFIPEPRLVNAPNGVEIYVLDMGEQEVVRIDLMFGVGKWEQQKLLAAMLTNLLLKEGVEGMSSAEVAEQLDYYGAWLQPSATYHNSYLTLYSLNKHITHTLPLFERIIKHPLFPEEEFEVIRDRRKQQFIINNEKVDVMAFNRFVRLLFGEEHPYGQCAEATDFDALTRDDLVAFYRRCYTSANLRIIVTGRVTDAILAQVIDCFGREVWGEASSEAEPAFVEHPAAPELARLVKHDALQSGVRIGLRVPGREHPDYAKLRVLNALLGGYFGSRLMMNIREEKGYTYSIGSSITTLKHASYLSIATQTANEYVEPLIQEVFAELARLREELVEPDELEMLRGYLMGEMARLFDGPFSIADAIQALLANNMTSEYYHRMIDAIQTVTAEELRDLARKYLIDYAMYVVVAGAS